MSFIINPYRFASGEFLPTDVTSATLEGWWDAADTGTITDTAGAVSQWDDKSTNGRDFKQLSASLQPETDSRTVNSLNVLDFLADVMALDSDITFVGDFTAVFMIFKDDTTVGTVASSTNSAQIVYQIRSTNTVTRTRVNNDNGDVTLTTPNAAQIAIVRRVGSTLEHYVNSGASMGTDTIATTNTITKLIGAFNTSGGTDFDGAIGEVSYYDDSVSDAELNQLGSSMADKWGLTWTDI